MLVLSRETNESIVLRSRDGGPVVLEAPIRVVVLRVAGQKVRLGIDAPEAVNVVRQELVPLPLPPDPSPTETAA